jgi:hypothetical protein
MSADRAVVLSCDAAEGQRCGARFTSHHKNFVAARVEAGNQGWDCVTTLDGCLDYCVACTKKRATRKNKK